MLDLSQLGYIEVKKNPTCTHETIGSLDSKRLNIKRKILITLS